MGRRAIVGMIASAFVCALAAPAAAHVSIDPPSVPKGSTAKLSFIVPNESATAKTNRVQIAFPPEPNAIAGVSVEAKTGWTFTVKTRELDTPIETDDGTISQVVSTVTWTATSPAQAIGADEFGEFTVNADGIPEAPDALVFRAVQSYTDGTSVRWVDPVTESGPKPENPTPILLLTGGTGETTTSAPTTAPSSAAGDTTAVVSTQDDNARALAIIGIAVGGVALILATGALMRRRRS